MAQAGPDGVEQPGAESQRLLSPARIALLLAALVVAFAIGFAVSRPGSREAGSAPAPGTAASIAKLQAAAEADPDNATAWQKLGLACVRAERFTDAVAAYDKATRIEPGQAALWSALGEARVMASQGDPMPPDALAAFRKANALDKTDARARYFLAMKRDLEGDHAGAIDAWLALLADGPDDAPWRNDVAGTVRRAGRAHGIAVEDRLAQLGIANPEPPLGPDARQVAEGARMPESRQRAMGEQMVARLEQRLSDQPGNIDGWILLMRSRMVLNQPDRARQALADALAANPQAADRLRDQAARLGIR